MSKSSRYQLREVPLEQVAQHRVAARFGQVHDQDAFVAGLHRRRRRVERVQIVDAQAAQAGSTPTLRLLGGQRERAIGIECRQAQLQEPVRLLSLARKRLKGLPRQLPLTAARRRFEHVVYPIEPSIWRARSRFSSTAYSIGSSLTNASKKPFTIKVFASTSVRPRLCR